MKDHNHLTSSPGRQVFDDLARLITWDESVSSALRLVPDNADALGGLGLTYYRAGHRDDAVRRLSEAIAVTPGNQELRDARARAEAST